MSIVDAMKAMQHGIGIDFTKKAPVIDTCDLGHKFAKLPDHPTKDGKSRCPICMSNGLDHARKKYDWLLTWFVRGGQRIELVPNGHIQPYTEIDVDIAIENLVK